MKFIGVDLHKKSISICVMMKVRGKRKVTVRQRFDCQDTGAIRKFFQDLGRFRVVVEATASYEWFFLLIEDLANRMVLASVNKWNNCWWWW